MIRKSSESWNIMTELRKSNGVLPRSIAANHVADLIDVSLAGEIGKVQLTDSDIIVEIIEPETTD